MRLNHQVGRWIELHVDGVENCFWRYSYGDKPKPYFLPLCTPSGHCLTLFEPHDHFWQRGLWFAIKYIDGENFWEEHTEHGRQRSVAPPSVMFSSSDSLTLAHDLLWERPNGGGCVFAEKRTLRFSQLDGGAYALDWDLSLVAQTGLVLDRTSFTSWGGYGGLTMRGNRNWQNTRLLFSDGSTSERPIGQRAVRCDLSGDLDGGRQQSGGIAIFDHPENARHPTPWYGATGAGHYFNAAFLFHEPMTLQKAETLRLRYRVVVHDEIWDELALNSAYDRYVGN